MRQNLPAVLKRAARRRVFIRKAKPGHSWTWEVADKYTSIPCQSRAEAVASLKLRRQEVISVVKSHLKALQNYGLKLFIKL